MNESENKTPEAAEMEELRQRCSVLDRHVTLLILALFVVSGTLTVFVGVQSRRVGNDLRVIRPQALRVQEAAAREQPVINNFMAKLSEYGRTHPDPQFTKIMTRFSISTNPAVYTHTNFEVSGGVKGSPAGAGSAVPVPPAK